MDKLIRKQILMALLNSFTYVSDDEGHRNYNTMPIDYLIDETVKRCGHYNVIVTKDQVKEMLGLAITANVLTYIGFGYRLNHIGVILSEIIDDIPTIVNVLTILGL